MVEHVEATPIDPPAILSGAELWLADASERVAERCELYRPPKAISTEREYKDAKQARTQVRKDYGELDAERKAQTRDFEDALKRFRSEVNDVLSPLKDIDDRYKRAIDAYEEGWRTRRHIELSQEYLALASKLDEVVPFGVVLKRFGEEREHAWLNRSTNVEQAKIELERAVEYIVDGYRQIDEKVPEEDRREVKAQYVVTLDLQRAMSLADELKERKQAIDEFDHAIAREPEAPKPERPRYAPPESHAWTLEIPNETRDKMMLVAEFMKANGIVYSAIYSGDLETALRKKRSNG